MHTLCTEEQKCERCIEKCYICWSVVSFFFSPPFYVLDYTLALSLLCWFLIAQERSDESFLYLELCGYLHVDAQDPSALKTLGS